MPYTLCYQSLVSSSVELCLILFYVLSLLHYHICQNQIDYFIVLVFRLFLLFEFQEHFQFLFHQLHSD